MTKIKIDIKPKENMIRIWNDGQGIPIEMHKEHKCYVPELIFGKLLTSYTFKFNLKPQNPKTPKI